MSGKGARSNFGPLRIVPVMTVLQRFLKDGRLFNFA
jgi:hypothetical protein